MTVGPSPAIMKSCRGGSKSRPQVLQRNRGRVLDPPLQFCKAIFRAAAEVTELTSADSPLKARAVFVFISGLEFGVIQYETYGESGCCWGSVGG
jgi:hypothetical protein